MTKANSRRLWRVEQAIGSLPLRPTVMQKAFEHFMESGELPEEQRLGVGAVCQQAPGPRCLSCSSGSPMSSCER